MNEVLKRKTSFQSTSKQIFKKIQKEECGVKRGAIEFDWRNKWLKGEEYSYILKNIDSYCKKFNFAKFPNKTHPPSIYTEPQNGTIYFVEGNSVGSEFGFPRVDVKKKYRWKKMNFTTDLPKKHPFVTYIVASAVKCEKFFPNSKNEGPSFRMHAVILSKGGMQSKQYNYANSSVQLMKGKLAKQNESKLKENLHRGKEDASVFISVPCSASIKSEESERNELSLKNDQLSVSSDRQAKEQLRIIPPAEKNYILCHIRKIDQNYKHSKFNGAKKEAVCDLENEIEGCSKRKKKKNSRKEQVNILNKSAGDTNTTEDSYTYESFPRKFCPSRDEATPIRTNFPVFMPDTGSRISFESENSTSSAFPAVSGYVPGMMTTIPKLNFQSLKINVGVTGTPKQLATTASKIDEVKELRFAQSSQGKSSTSDRKENVSGIESILANGVKKCANDGGCDYMQLFNLLTKFNSSL